MMALVGDETQNESEQRRGDSQGERRIYHPGDVATRLGISGAGLRRLAAAYERAMGELPRDERGRVWPEDAIERLERARAAVQEGQAVSVEGALRADDGEGGPDLPATPRRGFYGNAGPAEAILEELRGLRNAVEENNRRLAAMEEENRRLRAALPAVLPQEESDDVAGEQRDAEEEVEQAHDTPPAPTQEPPEGGLLRLVRRWVGRGGTRP